MELERGWRSLVGEKWNGAGGWPWTPIVVLVFAMCPDAVLNPSHRFLFNPCKIPMSYLSFYFYRR